MRFKEKFGLLFKYGYYEVMKKIMWTYLSLAMLNNQGTYFLLNKTALNIVFIEFVYTAKTLAFHPCCLFSEPRFLCLSGLLKCSCHLGSFYDH